MPRRQGRVVYTKVDHTISIRLFCHQLLCPPRNSIQDTHHITIPATEPPQLTMTYTFSNERTKTTLLLLEIGDLRNEKRDPELILLSGCLRILIPEYLRRTLRKITFVTDLAAQRVFLNV